MAYNVSNARKVLSALKAAGAPATALPYLMSQVAHETGTFNSRVLTENNNASGIMYINNPAKQKNARRGLAFPKKEGKYYYANFNTLKDWAVDYLRIIGGTVLKASSLSDYAERLKKRGYYTDSTTNYARGLNSHYSALKRSGILKAGSDHSPKNNNKKFALIFVASVAAGYLYSKFS